MYFPVICIHFLSIPFWCYGNGFMAGPADPVQQTVIAKLSLNNPYNNIWHCSKKIFHKTTQTERERERGREGRRERERERQRETEKERKRAIELDAKWYGNCRKWSTTGWISLIDFARWVNMRNRFCLTYAKLNGLPCMVPGYRFWGALSLYSVSCASLTKNSCNTKLSGIQPILNKSGLQPFWSWLIWRFGDLRS